MNPLFESDQGSSHEIDDKSRSMQVKESTEISCLISIILPVRNETYTLINACKSIASQSLKAFEIIIVDESDKEYFERYTLHCYEILKKAGVMTKLFHSDSRRGVGVSMVYGLLRAKGTFVFFMDADDFLRKDFTKVISNVIRCNPNKKIAYITFYAKPIPPLSLWQRGLFIGAHYLAVFRGGLNYLRKYGLVNKLRVYNRKFLLDYIGLDVKEPHLSYLDQPAFKDKLKEGLKDNWKELKIDDVLVYNIRCKYEPFGINFIYKRMIWYINSYLRIFSRNKHLGILRDVIIYLFIFPLLCISLLNIKVFTTLIILYILSFVIVSKTRDINILSSQALTALVFIPLLCFVKSVFTWFILIKNLLSRLLNK